VGVVLCPPFGWDDVCSYRSRRAWAEALALAGLPALRFDFPGTGDSAGSPRDPDQLEMWTRAVGELALWLRAETGCARVAALGIGLGGIVACHALTNGAEIDDLVLWAVPARGRALIRELRTFANLQAGGVDAANDRTGELEAGGFVMTSETVASLEQLDLTATPVPDGSRRRALLLERDGLAPDVRLREHFTRSGAAVSIAPGEGYGEMMDDPRLARAPRAVIARTVAWISEAAGVAGARSSGHATPPAALERLELVGEDGTIIIETPLNLEVPSGRLFGILAEPADGRPAQVCCVLFNAGAIRRVGPNRMWVELARRWAARGVPSVRIDLRALGDSDGDERRYASNDEYYRPELTDQALATLDALCELGLPDRFALVGLCSGAYWSLRAALIDPRVIGALMVNLWAFRWSRALLAERDLRRAAALLRGRESSEWISPKILRADLRTSARRATRLAGHILAGRVVRRWRRREIERLLDELHARDIRLLLQFSAGEPLYDDLIRDGLPARAGRWPNLAWDVIPGADHTFRALRLQRHVHARLDRALQDVLEVHLPPPT
jgi:pimeloyl-ACP methyl ester carboxylesterase